MVGMEVSTDRVQLKTTTALSVMRLSTLAATTASSNEPAWSLAMPAEMMHACNETPYSRTGLRQRSAIAYQGHTFLYRIGWREVGYCNGNRVDEPLRE